jgi:hypothetical protein
VDDLMPSLTKIEAHHVAVPGDDAGTGRHLPAGQGSNGDQGLRLGIELDDLALAVGDDAH